MLEAWVGPLESWITSKLAATGIEVSKSKTISFIFLNFFYNDQANNA